MTPAKPPRRLPTPPDHFRQRIYQIVGAIPRGRVITYGALAAFIPPPAGLDWAAYGRIRARWAGYALADCPDDLPWQRVVNAQGKISPRPGHGPHVQRLLLEEEGVEFGKDGRLDLARYGWEPALGWRRRRGFL
jgi:methylated-DNA-protein-cysteine methyltransferase-like protein